MIAGFALLGATAAPARADLFGKLRQAPTIPNAHVLAAKIDQFIGQKWQAENVTPAPLADDAEFLRRVYLDLGGRVPSVAEARRFLEDRRADKRQRLIDELLDSPRYPVHFSRIIRSLWLPEAQSGLGGLVLTPGFEAWLRKHLSANTPYDKVVHELITAQVMRGGGREQAIIEESFLGKPTPIAFFLAKELKAENLAASTSRLFLGVKLECAQCHDHPTAEWKREQFWNLAAFFAGLKGNTRDEFTFPTADDVNQRDIKIPNTETVIPAKFVDGRKPQFKDQVGSRVTLAEWLTAAENPYFARAAVNRVWSYFFGSGLIDPVDEMVGVEIKASHPELLDELARQFIASGFDTKFLIRAVVNSRAYQLTSAGQLAKGEVPALFARMPLRGLTGEQLFDSISQATGYQEKAPAFPIDFVPGNKPSPRAQFLTRFANTSEKATEFHTSILHALALMNGQLINDATSLEKSETLAAVANSPFLDTAERIEVLYLATLSRRPRAEELTRFVRYVENAGTEVARRNRALADVFWTLLNGGEFLLNH